MNENIKEIICQVCNVECDQDPKECERNFKTLHSLYEKIKGEMPKKKEMTISHIEILDTENRGYNQYHDEMLTLLANLFEQEGR